MNDWQDISTAPKDERIILANEKTEEVSQGYWDNEREEEGGQCWRFDGPYNERFTPPPTHWMPLPEPPEETK